MRHCDEYIDDPTQPACLRAFLNHARAPAIAQFEMGKCPPLFATYGGKRVRVVMASRFGDVGITENLGTENGYSARVSLEALTGFTKEPSP